MSLQTLSQEEKQERVKELRKKIKGKIGQIIIMFFRLLIIRMQRSKFIDIQQKKDTPTYTYLILAN